MFGRVLEYMTHNVRRCNLREGNGKRSMVVSDVTSIETALKEISEIIKVSYPEKR